MKKILVVIFCSFLSIIFCGNDGTHLNTKLDNLGCDYEVVECYSDGGFVAKIFEENFDDFFAKLDIEILSKNEVADRVIIEGYDSTLSNYIIRNGRRVNMQISVSDEILIGYPLIKNSF